MDAKGVLEMKAHLVAVKEMYQKMAMISLIIQSSMSVIAMLFIPLMWCFGRNETKRYEYRDWETDRKSTRLNSSHITRSRMPSSA